LIRECHLSLQLAAFFIRCRLRVTRGTLEIVDLAGCIRALRFRKPVVVGKSCEQARADCGRR
jgi:hypothetical protein